MAAVDDVFMYFRCDWSSGMIGISVCARSRLELNSIWISESQMYGDEMTVSSMTSSDCRCCKFRYADDADEEVFTGARGADFIVMLPLLPLPPPRLLILLVVVGEKTMPSDKLLLVVD